MMIKDRWSIAKRQLTSLPFNVQARLYKTFVPRERLDYPLTMISLVSKQKFVIPIKSPFVSLSCAHLGGGGRAGCPWTGW